VMSSEILTTRKMGFVRLVMSLRIWIGALTRPRRSTFPDSLVRRYALWLMIAAILIAASMITLDQWTINAVAKLPVWVNRGFKQLTDFGRSGWFLVPLGSCILAIAVSSPFMDRIGRFISAIVTTRLSFLFAAIALPDLFVTIAKHLIGRRRPSSLGPFVYDPLSWSPAFASLPSAHAATACSVAVAFGTLFPKLHFLLWTYAILIMASRIVISAHYPSDVMAGAFVGIFAALWVRDWFAERRLGLCVDASGGVRPLSRPSLARLLRMTRRR
jgi:membrane-associated phospholipid phosphatase